MRLYPPAWLITRCVHGEDLLGESRLRIGNRITMIEAVLILAIITIACSPDMPALESVNLEAFLTMLPEGGMLILVNKPN